MHVNVWIQYCIVMYCISFDYLIISHNHNMISKDIDIMLSMLQYIIPYDITFYTARGLTFARK